MTAVRYYSSWLGGGTCSASCFSVPLSLISAGAQPDEPQQELSWWHQHGLEMAEGMLASANTRHLLLSPLLSTQHPMQSPLAIPVHTACFYDLSPSFPTYSPTYTTTTRHTTLFFLPLMQRSFNPAAPGSPLLSPNSILFPQSNFLGTTF